MFESIYSAYRQSKPFLGSCYQATSSGITAGLYTLKTAAHVTVVVAYTAKAAVKTTYYGLKSLVTVAPAAYSYYTSEGPNAKAPKDETEENNAQSMPGFNFDAYDETLDDYNQAWDASAEEFASTAYTLAEEVYPQACSTAASFGKVLSSSWGCVGHAVKATGEGLLLAKDAAEYCLGGEESEACIADDYELVEEEQAAAPAA